MILGVSFLSRSGLMVSNLFMKVIVIGYDLTTLLNCNNFIICLVYHGGTQLYLDKCCLDLGQMVLLVI
jgi:hypothetical protein